MTYEDEQKAYFYARDNIIGKPFNFSGFIRCIFPFAQLEPSKNSFFLLRGYH